MSTMSTQVFSDAKHYTLDDVRAVATTSPQSAQRVGDIADAFGAYATRETYTGEELNALMTLGGNDSPEIDRISFYLMDDDSQEYTSLVKMGHEFSEDHGPVMGQVLTLAALGFSPVIVHIYDDYLSQDILDCSWLTPRDFFDNPDRSHLMRRVSRSVAELMDMEHDCYVIHPTILLLNGITETAKDDFADYSEVFATLDSLCDEQLFGVLEMCTKDCLMDSDLSYAELGVKDNIVPTIEFMVNFVNTYPSSRTYASGFCCETRTDWNNPVSDVIYDLNGVRCHHDDLAPVMTLLERHLNSVSADDYALMVEPYKEMVASYFVPIAMEREKNNPDYIDTENMMSPLVTGAVHDVVNGNAELFVTVMSEIARFNLATLLTLKPLMTLLDIITDENYHELPREWVALMVEGAREQ